MKNGIVVCFFIFSISFLLMSCSEVNNEKVNVPFTLDHNRMLVHAEIQKADGSFRPLLLWVDTGNPDFFMSKELALELGVVNPVDSTKVQNGFIEINSKPIIQIDKYRLNYSGVKSYVVNDMFWLFKASGAEANLPSTVLKNYDVVFDYPGNKLILAERGKMEFSGKPIHANIKDSTNIVQIDGICENDSISFAIDIGASYTFGSTELLVSIIKKNPDNIICNGAIGYANMWGWGLREELWKMTRIPHINFGDVVLNGLGMTVPPDFNDKGFGLMDWYSMKTTKPVDGFLGPNAFIDSKVGIDYTNKNIYFERKQESDLIDMDIVGITVRQEADGNFSIIGVASKNGIPLVEGVQPGDLLIQINDFKVKNKTMGKVIDALRGKPGEIRNLILERNGIIIKLAAKVQSIL